MNIPNSWLRGFAAARAASSYSDGMKPGKKMGAALFNGGTIVAFGSNNYKKSRPDSKERRTHAEQHCLMKRRYFDRLNNQIMYVWRETSEGPACSRPCSMCQTLMYYAGVKRVRFINLKQEYEEMRLS